MHAVLVCSGSEHNRLGGLTNKHLFLTILVAGKFKTKVPAGLVSGQNLLPSI